MRKLMLIPIMLICLSLPFACSAENGTLSGRILSSMTTEQKIAQLLMPAFYYHETEDNPKSGVQEIYPEMEAILHKYGFGGVIFNLQNAQDNAKAVRLVCAVQAANAFVPGRPQLITCTDHGDNRILCRVPLYAEIHIFLQCQEQRGLSGIL